MQPPGTPLIVLFAVIAVLVMGMPFGSLKWLFADCPFQVSLRDGFSLVCGIPAGLYLNRLWEKSQSEGRLRALLISLRAEFEKNIDYVNTAHDELCKGIENVPSFPLRTTTLDASAYIRYELIPDLDLARIIDTAHYELLHANRRIELLQQKAIMLTGSQNRAKQNEYDALLHHVNTVWEATPLYSHVLANGESGGLIKLGHDSAILLWIKLGTIAHLVGHTPFPVGKPPAGCKHGNRGVIGDCRNAIEAIDKVLDNRPIVKA